jgi:molybdate transport system permease protein
VSLEVQVSKKLADFVLDVGFRCPNGPTAILGPSGAGKSMLLRCIAGLERPDRGRIRLNDRTVFDSTHGVSVPARARHIGMLFQHYSLFPNKTIKENIAFGLRDMPALEREGRVARLIERLHIAGLEDRYPRYVSGGEQQRAALARALATQPEILLLDEPLSALDTHLRSQMEAELQIVFEDFQKPSLLVTHNIEEAYRLGQELLVLVKGKIAAQGPKERIFRNPPSLDVARLTGCKNFSRARVMEGGTVEAIDWGCTLRLAQPTMAGKVTYAGIRAHHIQFPEPQTQLAGENVFPCWLVRASETPFRVTLYLSLRANENEPAAHQLQAEISKDEWQKLEARPRPWSVRLPVESIFTVPE